MSGLGGRVNARMTGPLSPISPRRGARRSLPGRCIFPSPIGRRRFEIGASLVGRFASTVPYYQRYRQPYPPEFFRQVAGALRLDSTESLIDLGCGPGLLALGFAPYVRRVTGVDPEPAMLAAARASARAKGVKLRLIAGRTEDLPAGTGSFAVATIGRALHWMTPASTLAVLERLIGPGGAIVVCGSFSIEDPENPWVVPYERFRHRLSPERDRRRYGVEAERFFAGSVFAVRQTVAIRFRQTVTEEVLVGRLLSMSNTSREMLGPRADRAVARLRRMLAPFGEPDGNFKEVVEARAAILERTTSEPGVRTAGSRAKPRIPRGRMRRSHRRQ